MSCESKLCDRAKHTEGFNSAELACLDDNATGKISHGLCYRNNCALKDVLRACYDLKCFASDVELADLKVVAVFVLCDLCDPSYDNVLHIV